MEENHWITVLMHNKKKEFQVLNSTGKCSKRVLAKIAKLVSLQRYIKQYIVLRKVLHMDLSILFQRAEIAIDTKEVNALIETDHHDVSSWPIREYNMPSQKDGYVANVELVCTCMIHQ